MNKTEVKKIHKGIVIKNERVSESSYFIEIDLGYPMSVKPGQFISIYCEGLTFRRPFSVFSNNNGKIGILFKERGEGTNYIKSLKIGDSIDIAGIFGNGFNIKKEKSLLVGGGIGIAPLAFLRRKLNEQNIENFLMAGFLNKSEVTNITEPDKIYTDDGSMGDKGSVLDYLGVIINEFKPQLIYSCAPYPVLKQVAKMGMKYGIETQVAMEKVMACGIGVCRGCVIEIIRNEKKQNASVCTDGPIFLGDEVVWQ